MIYLENMRNSILKFPNIIVNNKTFTDFSKLCDLIKIPDYFYEDKYKDSLTLSDNTLIEGISYNIYNSTNYWDILFVYNNMKSLEDLPVSYDTVLKRVQDEYDRWVEDNKTTINYGTITYQEKIDLITEEEVQKNEKHRTFYYIKPQYINELLSYIKENINNYKYNPKLLVGV